MSAAESGSAGAEPSLTHFRREHVGLVFQSHTRIPSLTPLWIAELVTALTGPR